MSRRLEPHARTALTLQTLYHVAEALCTVFVGTYLWVNSLDFDVVCLHYLAQYAVVPVFFVLSGWYAQARDRLHVYRLGLFLHAAYYGLILVLRETAPDYAVPLGGLLGVAWGVYFAGANTFNFDVTRLGKREYYIGFLQALTGSARFLSPLVAGLIIRYSAEPLLGYHRVFGLAMLVYLVCFAVTFRMPSDNERRPFKFRRALFPGKDQRDWRLIMTAAFTLAGAYSIFHFYLGLLMFMETADELAVGGYAAAQAAALVASAYVVGRLMAPRRRLGFMRWGTIVLVAGGLIMAADLNLVTLYLFGVMRSVAGPMFAISHFGFRLDTIARSSTDPSERIEYLCAWEIPLAVGRVGMMTAMIFLYNGFGQSETGLRMTLLVLCSLRILTYFILSRSESLRNPAPSGELATDK